MSVPSPDAIRVDRFLPLALTSASRGAVADVVVENDALADLELEEPTSSALDSIRIRPLSPAVDVACYSSNQVRLDGSDCAMHCYSSRR